MEQIEKMVDAGDDRKDEWCKECRNGTGYDQDGGDQDDCQRLQRDADHPNHDREYEAQKQENEGNRDRHPADDFGEQAIPLLAPAAEIIQARYLPGQDRV